jgi:hypothetical protein
LRRNEEPPVQPLMRNNVVEDQTNIEEFEHEFLEDQDLVGDLNWLEDEGIPTHLTQDEYHESLGINNQFFVTIQEEVEDFMLYSIHIICRCFTRLNEKQI